MLREGTILSFSRDKNMEFSVLYRVFLGGILGRNGYKNRLIISQLPAYKFLFLGQEFFLFFPRSSCLLGDGVERALRRLCFSVPLSPWQERMLRQAPWLDHIGGGTLRLEEERYCTANCVA